MTRMISREGVEIWLLIFFFKSVVQAVLLFSLDTWVVTPCMWRALGGCQEQVMSRLAGRLPQQKTHRKWEYIMLKVVASREEAGFQTME